MAATTKPRKADVVRRAPSKAGVVERPVVLEDTEFEPLRFESSEEEVERVTLFYLDDVPYDVPLRFSPGLGLRVIRTGRREGDAAAMVELLEEVIGEEAYVALMNHKGLTQANLRDLMEAVQKLALGALDDPKDT